MNEWGGREERKKETQKNKRIGRTCVVASADRPKSAASDGWQFGEKKLEMIDDRPILVATYGVAYPPACSRYNGRRNLFPPFGREMSRFRASLESKFLLNDETPCYACTRSCCTCVCTCTHTHIHGLFTGTFDASIRAPWREKNGRGRKMEREREREARANEGKCFLHFHKVCAFENEPT